MQKGPDPVFDSDRGTGTTPPERAAESQSLTGRPNVERPATAFHVPEETDAQEREAFSEREAADKGGSFDAVAPPNGENKR